MNGSQRYAGGALDDMDMVASHKQGLSGDPRKLWGHVGFGDSPQCFYTKLSYGSMSGSRCCHNVEGIVRSQDAWATRAVRIGACDGLKQDGCVGVFVLEAVAPL